MERDIPQATTEEEMNELRAQAANCLALRRTALRESVFAPRVGRMICVFRSPDAESTRSAQVESGLPWRRAWAAEVVEAP